MTKYSVRPGCFTCCEVLSISADEPDSGPHSSSYCDQHRARLKQSSNSLAGRIAYKERTGVTLCEVVRTDQGAVHRFIVYTGAGPSPVSNHVSVMQLTDMMTELREMLS